MKKIFLILFLLFSINADAGSSYVLKIEICTIDDEAISNLDTESEAHIQKSLAQLVQGRTTIVIAHRLSTIKKAEQILVIEAGGIAERGTHKTLIAQKGRY